MGGSGARRAAEFGEAGGAHGAAQASVGAVPGHAAGADGPSRGPLCKGPPRAGEGWGTGPLPGHRPSGTARVGRPEWDGPSGTARVGTARSSPTLASSGRALERAGSTGGPLQGTAPSLRGVGRRVAPVQGPAASSRGVGGTGQAPSGAPPRACEGWGGGGGPRAGARRELARGGGTGVLRQALTDSVMPSQACQRGSTVRCPSSRQAAPLGAPGCRGSDQPISARKRSALA